MLERVDGLALGGIGASFAIVMAMTNPEHENPVLRFSQIIVPVDTPGFRIARGIQNKVLEAMAMRVPVVASQAAPSVDKTVVRIRSDQKPPERVVYDTSLPTIVPPQAVIAQAAASSEVPVPTVPVLAR